MAFRVGMKVACIYDGPWTDDDTQPSSGTALPVKDAVYTVSWIGTLHGNDGYIGIVGMHPTDCFAAECFRPVAYPKQSEADDIAMIRALVERIDPILACELTYADEIEARMVALDAAMNRLDLP